MDEQKLAESRANMTPEEQQALDELLANMAKNENASRSDGFSKDSQIPWLALVGAFLGCVPGIIIWAIAGSFGLTWSLLGALIVAGAFLAYTKVCDHTNADESNLYGLIGVLVICVIAVYLGVHFAWAGQLHNALKEYGYDLSLGECAARLYEFLGLLELRGKFVGAIFKGFAFSALGGFGLFAKAGK